MNGSRKKFLKRLFVSSLIISSVIIGRNHIFTRHQQLKNILNLEINSGQNIFFVETSGAVNADALAQITSRHACSVESAALANPNSTVFMIFSEKSKMLKTKILEALKEYNNILFVRLKLEEFSQGSIIESWIASGKIYNSSYIKENFSNVLRLLLLQRFSNF